MPKKNTSKQAFIIVLGLVLNAAGVAQAVEPNELGAEKHIAMAETTGLDTVLDMPLRLGGLVTTLVGTGIFIGTSPITGLMSAIYPHDAIEQAADYLVLRPAHYTFVRPSGDINYDSRPYDEK